MPDRAGSLERLAVELGNALRKVFGKFAAEQTLETLADFGVAFPPQLLTDPGFSQARSAAVSAARDLDVTMRELSVAIEGEDVPQIVAIGLRALDDIRRVIGSFDELSTQLQSAGPSMPGVTGAQVAELTSNFPRKLLDFVVAEQLDAVRAVGATLTLLGIFDRTLQPGSPGNPTAPPFESIRLRLDRLGPALTGPEQLFRDMYDWGEGGFDGQLLFPAVNDLIGRLGLPSRYVPPTGGQPAKVETFAFDLTPAAGSPPGLAVDVVLPVEGGVDRQFTLPVPPWTAHVKGTAALEVGTTGTVRPPLAITLTPPTPASGAISGEGELTVTGRPATPFVVVGVAGGSRVEVAQVDAALGFVISWDSVAGQAALEPHASAAARGGRLVIDASQGDGFIAYLLSGRSIDAGFETGLTWDPTSGVTFTGSSALVVALPVHIAIGPLELPTVYLVLGVKGGGFELELSTDLKASLGPLVAVASRLGAIAELSFPPTGGNLGPVDLRFEFKPPNGVGLTVDAGVVKGGGYLFIDKERGEYAGALELDFTGIVALKAIGIITTRMPDGTPGFSLLIVITADFGTGIQLGFGFTLVAVGGVLGLNRRMALQALMDGIRSNAVSSVMFPQDVVANAPRIISDLRVFFPPQQGTFLIGPMAKLGWGTPALVTISIGVVVEVPGNVAIVGVLRVALPADEVALIVLQVNFAGAIEFDRKRVYFFAALYDSRIVFLTIEGEMGVLAAFGDDANFVLSVGGFHPSFQPPALPFPSPKRIAVDILNSPTQKLRVEGYFAVTTNTAQFGARVDARLGFDECGVQGHLAFDALLQFSPLHFIVTISASVELKVFGMGLFSVRLRFELQGPTPWRAKGSASLSLLFFDIDVEFDITWGESRDSVLPPVEAFKVVKAELDKPQSWRAMLPAANNLLVSLRKLDPAEDTLVLHPVGVLRVSQRAVPLDLTIDRVGNRKPSDAKRFTLTVGTSGLDKQGDVDESFAPAQFQDFSDAEKLGKPAFQDMHGGIDLSVEGEQMTSGAMVKRVIRYELITIDGAFRNHQRFVGLLGVLFTLFLDGAAVTKLPISHFASSLLVPFDDKITVHPGTFVVASQLDNVAVATFASEAMASEHLAQEGALNPNLAATLHVIPAFEAA